MTEDKDLINAEAALQAIRDNPTLTEHQKKLQSLPILKSLRMNIVQLEKQRDAAAANAELKRKYYAALTHLADNWPNEYKLQKNDCSRIHKVHEAFLAHLVIDNTGHVLPDNSHNIDWKNVQPFVVQHDWASAFENATDYASNEYKLPFEHTSFEFRITGITFVAFAYQNEGNPNGPMFTVFAESLGAWVNIKKMEGMWGFIASQIKAICVALEAEVATHNVTRAAEKLNKKRLEEGKVPLYSFHVVSLNRQSRPARLPLPPHEPHARRRLHFRRGHWRHYEQHKTWIKWMLVGDPELGFIEKEYKL